MRPAFSRLLDHAQNEVPFLLWLGHLNRAEISNRGRDQTGLFKQLQFSSMSNRLRDLDRPFHQLSAGDRMAERQNINTTCLGSVKDDRTSFRCPGTLDQFHHGGAATSLVAASTPREHAG